MSGKTSLDINDIKLRIPHRYPMLMIDRIEDIVSGESGTGIKAVSGNEPFFAGHFPTKPIMPGVLIIEAMAQTAGTLVIDSLGYEKQNLVYFMSIEEARFRSPVVPGDLLKLKVKKEKQRGNIWRFSGHAYVGDELKAEAVFMAMLAEQ